MVTIPVRTRLQVGGILNLQVATGLPEADVEVVVIVQPVETLAQKWPDDFFVETFGAFADHPLERGNQGVFDVREALS